MAGMKKNEQRREEILRYLKERGQCSREELMEKFGISMRTVKEDIALLREQIRMRGFDISSRKGQYELVGAPEDPQFSLDLSLDYYETANAKTVRKLEILHMLEENTGSMSLTEILKYMERYHEDGLSNDRKTIRSTLEEMCGERLLEQKGHRFFLSVQAPVQLKVTDTEAYDILDLLETCSKDHPYAGILEQVRRKMTVAILGSPEADEHFDSYYAYQKSFVNSSRLRELLAQLNRFPFEKKILEIRYRSAAGKEAKMSYAVGNVVYSVDKDQLYLLGEANGKKKILIVPNILEIKTLDRENKIFQNAFYTEIVDRMFSVSLDPAEYVKVAFDKELFILEKLDRLRFNRPQATITQTGEELIYEDEVSGLPDFANYLRCYGYHCRVLEPPSLRSMMLQSAQRLLASYDELEKEGEE